MSNQLRAIYLNTIKHEFKQAYGFGVCTTSNGNKFLLSNGNGSNPSSGIKVYDLIQNQENDYLTKPDRSFSRLVICPDDKTVISSTTYECTLFYFIQCSNKTASTGSGSLPMKWVKYYTFIVLLILPICYSL